jgi:hypothetical protein
VPETPKCVQDIIIIKPIAQKYRIENGGLLMFRDLPTRIASVVEETSLFVEAVTHEPRSDHSADQRSLALSRSVRAIMAKRINMNAIMGAVVESLRQPPNGAVNADARDLDGF